MEQKSLLFIFFSAAPQKMHNDLYLDVYQFVKSLFPEVKDQL
jgi:hypothetical protein